MPAGKLMSFMRRAVVRIHRRRRHAPLLLVHRLAQLGQVALALKVALRSTLPSGSSRFTVSVL